MPNIRIVAEDSTGSSIGSATARAIIGEQAPMPGPRTLKQRMLGYLRQILQRRTDRPAIREVFPRLYDSQLETRRVLNADAANVANDLLAVVLNAGTAADDGRADHFEVTQAPGQLRDEIAVSINGQQVWQGSNEQFSHVRLQGSSDHDQFTIDPGLTFTGTISIDGGINRPGTQSDVLIVLPGSSERTHSVMMQDRLGGVQLQFNHSDSGDSATSIGHAVWEVTHVGQIVDYTHSAERTIQLSRQEQWTLSDSTDSAGNAMLRLSSKDMQYDFVAPESALTIDMDSPSDDGQSSAQQLYLHNLDLGTIQRVNVIGDRLDSILQTGSLRSSRELSMLSGSTDLAGDVTSTISTKIDVQSDSIIQSGTIRLGPNSSLKLDSGSHGTTIVQGQISLLGNETQAGGTVIITGDKVQLDGSALIDVSGARGGGAVLVGGDRAGANVDVRNARQTTIATGARINADATWNGNGGRIVVYSLDRTSIGNADGLSARGGTVSGAGGFIETSGKRHLSINGTPGVGAVAGRAGQWLIDPEAISIVTTVPAIPDPNISYVTIASLQAALSGGGDVILQTTTINPALGDIVIENDIVALPGVSARLILQAARDIVFNGSFTGNANLGLKLEATRDVDALGISISGVDHLDIQSGGDVLLDQVTVGTGSANAGVALNVNATATIELDGDITSNGGSISFTGSMVLADNVVLTTQGNSAVLTLDSLITDGAAHNLQLVSDGNIVTKSINLQGGTLTAQVDANNDGVASFTSTAQLTAGTIQLNGSAAKDDTLSAQSDLTSTVGAITLNNFNQARLSGDSISATNFTATNINTFDLNTGADITASGAINLDSTVTGVLLSGASNSTNKLTAQTTSGSVALGPVTSTNTNVDLSITSARGASLKSITLTGGQVDVTFSQNNPANNSTVNFTGAVNSDGLTVTGASRTNDAVNFNSSLTLGAQGLSVTQVATAQVLGIVTSTTGNIAITTTSGTTLSADMSTTGGSITVSGTLNLGANVTLTKQGNSGSLTVGTVDTVSSVSRNLSLVSDTSITTGQVNLHDGALTAQVDANNDGVASFTSTAAITAGTIQLSGSAAKNDTLSAQSDLTSTVGAITLNNFNQARLSGDSISATNFTATNINTFDLNTGADITASGAINLDSTVTGVLLSGTSNSTNKLTAQTTNGSVALGPVTSTNSNVDLSITSARGVSLKSITLTGGQVDVTFSQNNPANNSTVNFTGAVNSDGLSVTGASRTNDSVIFDNALTLGGAGLSVTQVATTQLVTAANVTTTTGAIVIASSTATTLASNLTTAGGAITLSGAKLAVDGTAARTLSSGNGGTAASAGDINLNGLTTIEGVGAPADLTLDAQGATNGGTVRLGTVSNAGTGIRNLTVDTRGASGQLIINNGIAGSTSIVVTGNLNLTNAQTLLTDDVDMTVLSNTSTLSLGAVSTDAARNLQLTSDNNIAVSGVVNLQGGTLTAQVDANNDGVASLTSTAPITAGTIQLSGSAAKNDTLSAQSDLTSTVGAITLNNFNQARLSGDSISATNFTATNINTFDLNTGADITASGAINLDSTVTGVLLSGASNSTNKLTAQTTSGSVALGPVTSTNTNVDLSITSARGASLKSITLTGGQVDVTFSQNNPANNSTVNFTGAVNSDGLTVTGASRTNDAVNFNSSLTLGAQGLSVTQVATAQVLGIVTSTTGNIAITTTSGTTLSADMSTTGGSITVSGTLNLGANVTLTKQGNSGSLTVGTVDTVSSVSRNLSLVSDTSITTGQVNLHDGALTAQVDANNDGVASFTSTAAITAGTIQLSGSAAKNDTLSAQSDLTSTVGAITLNNFNQARLSGDSISATNFTATNINTFDLNTGADITASGAINLDSTVTGVLLSGTSNSTNKLTALTTNGSVALGPVTSTNSNVDLSITSARGVSLKSITLTGAQVDVIFSQNNPANNSTVNFTGAVNSDGLSVTGASRTNDSVIFDNALTLGGAGLSVTQVATTQLVTAANVTTTTGAIVIASSTATTLASNLTTAGGAITLSGAKLVVDGTAARTLSSGNGGTAASAGDINLNGLTTIEGVGAPADLTLDAQGATNGGTVRLGTVSNAGTGIRNLTVDTRGASGQLIIDNGIAGSTSIVVTGNLNLTNAQTLLTDDVDMSVLSNTSTLSLGAVSTDAARNLQLTSDNNIAVSGVVNLQGGTLTAQVDANNDGVASLTSTAPITAGTIQLSGSAAKNDTLSAQSDLTSTVGAITLNNFNQARLTGDSISATNFTATNINTFDLNTGADITASGAINLDSTVTGVLLSGTSNSTNKLTAQTTSGSVALGPVTSTNTNVDLSITSARGASLKSITLTGGQVDVTFSQNNPANNSTVNFTGAVNSDGLKVTGANRTNDAVSFSSPLTLGNQGLVVDQIADVNINADINSIGRVAITQVSRRIQLVQNGRVVSGGDIDLRTGVAQLELLGAAGTLNQISSSGDSATVQLANTTSALGSNLDVLSNRNVVLGDIDLNTAGRLLVEADRNNNNAGATVSAGNLRGSSITIQGSAAKDDTASLTGTIQTTSGAITVRQFETVTMNADVTSATAVTVSDISQQLRLGSNVDLLASNGNLTLLPGSGQIFFTGTAATTNILDARGSMNLATLNATNNLNISLLADGNVQLAGSTIAGTLNVTAGNHAAPAGTIETSQRLTASQLTLNAANGIGAVNELQTSANSISATNRLSGDIRIDNVRPNTIVDQLSTVSGGNIKFRQSGSATFNRVETLPDGTPAANENQVDLEAFDGNLTLASAGLASDGVGAITLKTLSSGNVSLLADLQVPTSDVTIASAQNILGTGLINGKTVRLDAVQSIGGTTALRTQTTQLSSLSTFGQTNISNASVGTLNVTDMRSQLGGSIALRQSGGNAVFANVITGAQSVSGPPDIVLINDTASLVFNGIVSAGGTGSIDLRAQQDVVLASTSQLVTSSDVSLIQANAVGQIHFNTGAVVRAGTGTPATEAVMTQLPPLLNVIAVVNSIGVNVDTNGLGVIDIFLLPSGTGVIDQNYDLTIEWGANEVDRLPLGPTNANTPPIGVSRFDAALAAYRVSHQYLQNPNPNDPSADIPVRVTAQVDSLNRIRFTDSTGIDQRFSATSNALLVVPSTGLVSLYFVLPQTPTIQKQLVFARDNTELPPAPLVVSDRSEPQTSTSTTSSVQKQRKIVLRLMIPVDEFGRVEASKDAKDDIPLTQEDLENLDDLFSRLSDNRYRIYLIMEDGNEILLKDILLRNHQPAEIEDAPNIPELDRTNIPLLDETLTDQPLRPISQRDESSPAAQGNETIEKPVETGSTMIWSWRKAARRFRAG